MKLLYTVIILSLMQNQFWIIKPLCGFSTNCITSLKYQLQDFCQHEMKTIEKDFVIKAKHLCQQLLKDKEVQKASTPVMKEFKKNLTDFLYAYPYYKRYGFFNQLVVLYHDKITNTKHSSYISKLLDKLNYDVLDLEYENKFAKFVREKFQPKFEELKTQLTPDELKQQKELLNWFNGLKKCQHVSCIQEYFYILFTQDRTPKEKLLKFIEEKLDYFNMLYGNTMYKIMQDIIKDPKLSEISSLLRQQMKIDINEFIMKFESNQDINELKKLNKLFYNNIVLRYYYSTDISNKDFYIIRKIFRKHGYDEFDAKYRTNIDDFIKHDLFLKIEEYKTALIREEMPLLEGFEELKRLNGEERREKFYEVYYLLKSEI